ncbi:hypothetical protein [Bifidobacterium mongoliense]|uniref:hypothetical protein n=1 Tax=Bifidobacterium mongoliense TaxID=518643 RepID=UPI0026474BDB|nr:hypothetical protein [Bifidobacterium mongoliense]MDN5980152.1 hypothetical protein [Bifidobacterium mongoliense]
MSIEQEALNALADAGLGSDAPADAFILGYKAGHRKALEPLSDEDLVPPFCDLFDDTDAIRDWFTGLARKRGEEDYEEEA